MRQTNWSALKNSGRDVTLLKETFNRGWVFMKKILIFAIFILTLAFRFTAAKAATDASTEGFSHKIVASATSNVLHDLMIALYNDDQASVTSLLNQGAPVNGNEEDRYPIHVAADWSSARTMKALIDHGADLDVLDGFGYTALHRTVGYSLQVQDKTLLLISSGANPNIKSKQGQTPLHWASHGSIQNVQALLNASSINVNAADNGKWTPLMIAATSGRSPEIVNALLAKGADRNIRNDSGYTALTLAQNWLNKYQNDAEESKILKEIIQILVTD